MIKKPFRGLTAIMKKVTETFVHAKDAMRRICAK